MNNMYNCRFFAEGEYISNNTFETNLNNNDLIIGPSGAGKTGGYVIPNILRSNSSMIVADTKGNLYKKYASDLRKRGYDIYVLDFVDPENSCTYNPLDYVHYDEKTKSYREQDIMSIANTLVPLLDKKEPFWEQSSRQVVACIIAYVLEAFKYDVDRNLCTVLEVFRAISSRTAKQNEESGIPFLEEWALTHPDSFVTKKYKMFRAITSVERTWGCILQFIAVSLDKLDFREGKHIFDWKADSNFRIEKLGNKRTVLFLNVSDTDRTFDSIVNIFYTQAFQVLCREADKARNNRLRIPVRIIMDDFATNVYIENFDKIISVIRSREISVSIILQSMTQLETMYSSASANTIVNNCDHIIYLGGSDLKTAEYIAEKSCKSVESVLCMELDKAYLLCRGKRGKLVNKIKPYSVTPKNAWSQSIDEPCESFELNDDDLPFA